MNAEVTLLNIIFNGNTEATCHSLLTLRNKMFDLLDKGSEVFTEDELKALNDVSLDYCEDNGYITWDEDLGCFVRTSDGLEITEL